MTEQGWPEPIATTSGQTAAAMVRQLWSKAQHVDAAVADANWLREIVGSREALNGIRTVRVVTAKSLIQDGFIKWNCTVLDRAPNPGFILFYNIGSSFPESALIITGGCSDQGWVTFHRRPFVLYRLLERFRQLSADHSPLSVIAGSSVREQPTGGGRGGTQSSRVDTTDAQPVSPQDLYRQVLNAHFSDLPHDPGLPRPTEAPTLASHQERAYERAEAILDRYGGVIIADAVGLGKTYIGLRLLERTRLAGGRLLVIVPAALKDQWERELAYLAHPALGKPAFADPERGQRRTTATAAENLDLWVRETELDRIALLSIESLGRRSFNPESHRGADLVLVDEAHNFRNASTRRYRNLAILVRHSRIVMLTASPINNTVLDLQRLVDLFAAPGAFRHLGVADYRDAFHRAAAGEGDLSAIIAACVVRRTRRFLKAHYGDIEVTESPTGSTRRLRFPVRQPPLAVNYDLEGTYGKLFAGLEEWLNALTFPAIDGQGHVTDSEQSNAYPAELLKIILLKRLESSVEAFRSTIVQQLAWCNTALKANEAGRVLTRPDYRASFQGPTDDPGAQLAFYELMLPVPAIDKVQIDAFRQALTHDLSILARIHTAVVSVGAAGDGKLQKLIDLLDGPLAGRKLIIFTEYRDTARYIYHALKQRPHVAQIDSDSARLGQERAGRREIIERFAPLSNGLPLPPERERVDVLVATDVLSEGLNLQDASAVISYDLPWNPVRLMQRIGRIDRLGAIAETVQLYHFVPANVLDRLLNLMSRLLGKVSTISTTIGLDHPPLAAPGGQHSATEQIRLLARDPNGLDRVERQIEGPLDPEEQAYLDHVRARDTETPFPTQDPAVSAVSAKGGGLWAASYWRLSCGGLRRALWLVCDLEHVCVSENQIGALEAFRSAGSLKKRRVPTRLLATARLACERYARHVLTRLEAADYAADALTPGLPQCRIAAWLGRHLEVVGNHRPPGERARLDAMIGRLSQRFSLPGERAIAELADRLPGQPDPDFLEKLDRVLAQFEAPSRRATEIREIATLLLIPARR